MKRKCDHCEKPATHHSVEIIKGQKIEKHLCDQHASEAGIAIKAVHTPINELLSNFVKLQGAAAGTKPQETLVCTHCKMTFSEFREHSLLGCPHCYTAFEEAIVPLMERAHEGASHHIGKVPHRAGDGEIKQQQLMKLRKQMSDAVAAEDYEGAAKLRDEIRQFEEQGP